MNPFQGPARYAPADFLADVTAIGEMLAAGEPARVAEPDPMVCVDDVTGQARLVYVNTDLASYKVYAYFLDKYGEPGLRRHVVYFGVLRYLRQHRDALLRAGRLRAEDDGVHIDPGLLADLLDRPAESFL
jgi:hypothetical protein